MTTKVGLIKVLQTYKNETISTNLTVPARMFCNGNGNNSVALFCVESNNGKLENHLLSNCSSRTYRPVVLCECAELLLPVVQVHVRWFLVSCAIWMNVDFPGNENDPTVRPSVNLQRPGKTHACLSAQLSELGKARKMIVWLRSISRKLMKQWSFDERSNWWRLRAVSC